MTFQEENNQLLEKLISIFYKEWEKPLEEQKYDNELTLELAITSDCNQKCEYCYLVKNKDKLFPPETRSLSKIKENLNTLLDYYLKKGFSFGRVDLFSGEIWGTKFGYEILSIILSYVKKGLRIKQIIIPSNCSFILNEKALNSIQYMIDEFYLYDVRLIFSASVDGQIIEAKTRPFKNSSQNELKEINNFYEKLAIFLQSNHYGIHPMISAYAIEDWIENYEWWKKWHQTYFKEDIDKDPFDWFRRSMFLEVRNNDWTTDKILHYLKFLNYLIDDQIENMWLKNDLDIVNYFIFHYQECINYRIKGAENIKKYSEPPKYIGNYDPTIINRASAVPICSITRSLIIRMGDLAIIPCHRTSYDRFIYGFYKINKNNELTIEANNPLLANKIYRMRMDTNPLCNNCEIKNYCLKGCYGAQYEETQELFYPLDSVCDFYKAKFIFMYKKIHQIIKNYNLEDIFSFSESEFDKIYQELMKKERSQYWKQLIDMTF